MKTVNQIFIGVIAFIVSASAFGCESEVHNQLNHNHGNDPYMVEIPKQQGAVILVGYLNIKDALVATDGKKASQAAKEMLPIEGEGDLIEKIKFDIEHISNTQDPGHQRDHFNSLSENIYTMVKETGCNDQTVYKQYCPMAFGGQGAFWLSSEKEVNNPYFGDKMLHCGSVKEKL